MGIVAREQASAADVRETLDRTAHVRSTPLGVALAAFSLGAWIATLVGVVWFPHWSLKIACGLLNGLFVATSFVVGHDAAHGSLTPRRWLNRLLGRICLLPSLHPYMAWVHTHNGLHHGFTNIKGKDPGFPPLTLAEYQALPTWRRWLERRFRTAWGLGLYYFVEMWLRWEMFPSRANQPRDAASFRLDRLTVVAFAAAWAGWLAWAGIETDQSWWGMVLIGFVLPTAVWNYLIGFTIFQHHTHPRLPWFRPEDDPTYFRTQVQSSPHVMLPWAVDAVMHQIMEHTAHHASPGVPLYRLRTAQKTLERKYRRDIVRILWTPANFLTVLRTCKLYDFAEHRWLDYSGKPTTASLRPASQCEIASKTEARNSDGQPVGTIEETQP